MWFTIAASLLFFSCISGSSISIRSTDCSDNCAGVINTCVFCDSLCNYKISTLGSFRNSEEYVDFILRKVTRAYSESGLCVKFIRHQMLGAGERVKIDSSRPSDLTGHRLTEMANKIFWEGQNYASLKSQGCEMGVFLATGDLWSEAGTIGAANFASTCTEHSYISIDIESDASPERVSSIFAHEAGHSFGMSHDLQPIRAGYKSSPFNAYSQGILRECTETSEGCSEGSEHCEMVASLTKTSKGYPKHYSKCSVEYFKFWCAVPSNDYDRTCLQAGDLTSSAYLNSATYEWEQGLDNGSGEE